ncbi:hypothetical protein [Almyronema epifaneia]|uniref:Uncharacterized protein n=1 Tax=Almyronema epifaneia S1 TaxID=2991925 RepID=A0ABW6IA27_9CYAN
MKTAKRKKSTFRKRSSWLEYGAFCSLILVWTFLVFLTVNDHPLQTLKQVLSHPTAVLFSKLR